ncbi:MAG: hypothetical protein HQK92_09900 [Nitrospirae bacterium]|nr:hypothetical protein [Nitrospirota bacterium]
MENLYLSEEPEQRSETDAHSNDVTVENGGDALMSPVAKRFFKTKELNIFKLLNEDTASPNIGNTVKEIVVSLVKMEAELNEVLSINSALVRDIESAKGVISELRLEKAEREALIEQMREEIPAKSQLMAEVEYMVNERNAAQASIHDLKVKTERAVKELELAKMQISELESEKADLVGDIGFLESKLERFAGKLEFSVRRVNVLEGERVINLGKIADLQKKYRDCVDAKFAGYDDRVR